MKELKNKNIKGILATMLCSFMLIIVIVNVFYGNNVNIKTDTVISNMSASKSENDEFIYLSDIDYVANESSTAWGSILKDKTSANGRIQIKINGGAYSFDKGMWAHATSVLLYDLTNYDYDYFTSYIGLNTTSKAGNGVTYRIYTSVDKTSWKLEKESVKLPQADAEYVKIDIRGKKYLKLEANDNIGNGQDHSVYADAKLTKTSYEEAQDVVSLEKCNEKIQSFGEIDFNNKEHELAILQRDLIKNASEFVIKRFIGESAANKEAFEWLFNDVDNLRLYIMGGKPTGNYYNSFKVLQRLLETHKSDFDIQEVTKYGTKYGDLYKRMAITLSLTHSAQVSLWMQPGAAENQSDAVTRYEIYKELHKNNKFKVTDNIDITKWFESYTVEEMRFVMNNLIDDESIVWLNEYVQSKIDANPNSAWSLLTPHPYMAYVWPNYGNPVYYDDANYDYFNELFSVNGKKLYDYGITRGTNDHKVYKVWMNFRNKFGTGAVCGGISKSGSNIRATHGIPAAVIGQPGHAAIIYYTQDAQGRGYWNLDNDVSGWTLSEKGERMLLGWGNESYQRGYSVVYMALSQEVLNNFETFEESQKRVLLADVYQNDLAKRERFYREALEIMPININAWYGLIMTYNADSNKTEDEYYELARELAEKMVYFPLPMQHLTNLIKPKLTSLENDYRFTLLQTRILTEGTRVPNNTAENYYVYQPSLTRLEANYLLGRLDKTIATFSFDGDDAGKIVLANRFNNTGVRWDYSLDGGSTWNEVAFSAEEEHKLQLTKEQIASITAENDIKIHIVGVNYSEENIYTIDITKSATPTHLFGNDLENRVIGINLTYEWRRSESDAWTSYRDASPDNTGDKQLQVRIGATGTRLPSDTLEFSFTEDNQPDTRKYVSISHLSIQAFSTQADGQGRYATNAIDGNYNTNWHSAWNGTDTQRFITIKLDKPRYVSAVEFVPGGGGNGKILDGTVYGSVDGENWIELSKLQNLRYTNQANTNEDAIRNIKSFEIADPQEVQYIKIVANRASNGNWFTARAFNIYQDLTKNPRPTAGVGYSITTTTNQDVVARLINPSTNITITNNGGSDTYTFQENGEFTFEFVDENGIVGSSTAVVNWIDKVAPTATLEYSTTDKTNEDVTVRLIPNEEVTVLNNGEASVENPNVDPFTYTFTANGEFTFEFRDKAGNIGHATACVDWIDTELPEATLNYSSVDLTNQDVIVTISFNKENVTITNNGGSDTYTFQENGEFTFEFVDEAGNVGRATAKVNYIDKVVPNAILVYSKTELTNQDVEVVVVFDKENVIITNNNGSNKYTFQENGEFVFEYRDQAGNTGSIQASVDYIDKTAPVATITYDKTTLTNEDVVATITFDKENVTVLNNSGKNTYTFQENGKFTFEYVDEAGNSGIIKAQVDWIDKVVPVATITYSKTTMTNQNVVAAISFNKENVVITNNEGQNTYTFQENGEFTFHFVDAVGNAGLATAVVNWIDKNGPDVTITYDKTTLTNQSVIATITFDQENVVITNNDGQNTYTFTENGQFTFDFIDNAGNVGHAKAIVDWIDKVAPVATITYDKTTLTNQNVTANITFDKKNVVVTNNDGKTSYTFQENGEFTFEYVDEAGNTGSALAKVDWIDKVVPEVEIEYNITTNTNQSVVAILKSNKNLVVLNNISNVYVFTENGEFTFEYQDEAGNKGTITAKVDWIDKIAPKATIAFDKTTLTNQDVVATITFDEENVTILNNEGRNTYTFQENGEFTFEFQDQVGNKGTTTIHVNWIDKTAPIATITYDKFVLTNQNVTATITFDKENVTVLNNDGKTTHTFQENGEFTFEYIDAAGNKGIITANVNWIDKVVPVATITYDRTALTNQDVTATITFDKENVTILNNGGKDTYTFMENGEITFEYQDEAGNKGTVKAVVCWIDKIAPKATITYSKTILTNQNVVATITFDKENVVITNNEGQNTYTFQENGEFTFEYVDEAGNTGSAVVKVDWINKNGPEVTLTYDKTTLTNQNVVATITFDKENVTILNNDGQNTYTFTKNGEFTFEFVDQAGNKGTVKANVNWIDKVAPVATITYDKTILTNQDVVATITFDKENVSILNNSTNKYTFTENGEFTFEYRDQAGNTGSMKASVNWIDKVVPVATITYDKTTLTNQNVTANITFDKKNVVVTNNDGKTSYTFQENGEFTFEYRDQAGNTGSMKVNVNWIDRKVPTATIHFDKNFPTNQSIKASITFDKENVTITNNGGRDTYTFQENGEFTFEFIDEAGNTGSAVAKVDWINKNLPNATITYDYNSLTNQNVVATITFDKENVTILNNDGQNTYTFQENGEFIFEFMDEAGNKGGVIVIVNWIDKVAPVATITYDHNLLTNQNVTAKISFDESDVSITNNDGKDFYTFIENGEFTFEFVDKAGNTGRAVARVDWIDRERPIPVITFNRDTLTNQDVVATITFNKQNVTIINNEGKNSYVFKENGEFTFEYVDEAGNKNTTTVKVDWIDKVLPHVMIEYSTVIKTKYPVIATVISDEDIIITNNDGKNTYTFQENGEFTFEYRDQAGNVGQIIANVNWIANQNDSINIGNPSIKYPTIITPNENNTIKSYSKSGIKISFNTQNLQEIISFNKNDLSLPESLKNRFSSLSEYFELSVQTEKDEKNYLDLTPVKMIIRLDPTKTFLGIYEVNGSVVEKLNYTLLSKFEIEVNTTGLGNYILSYEEDSITNEPVLEENKPEKEKTSIFNWLIALLMMILGCAGFIVYKKKTTKEVNF